MYYTVWIRSLAFRGKEVLTYSSEELLGPGQIVAVPLQQEQVLGIIVAQVGKPIFATKPIARIFPLPSLPPESLKLAHWLQVFYETTVGAIGNLFLPATISTKAIEAVADTTFMAISPPQTSLTTEQNAVVTSITKPDTYLLHGRTGSGKTRVYIELAQQTISQHKSAIILTPEISLTSQLSNAFRNVFHERVVVLHSKLTAAQHQKIWLQILTTQEPLVVIGPRSALFVPLPDIGLIVVDEAHETTYKQEQAPYYHALRVASQLAQLHQAVLVIGSATPAVGDYFMAEQRHKPILKMEKLAQSDTEHQTKLQIIDIKDRSLFSRNQHLSTALIAALHDALERGEQSLVYLNRRGTARLILCEVCGWQAMCPHCDLPLVYHGDSGQFRCHTCGYHEPLRTTCPACGNPSISFKSFGTKAITHELEQLLPEARIQRFDTDNLASERFEDAYDSVRNGEVDIIVGTQLLAKGLDLPRLSTLGIVVADSSLSMPDFSAQERTFQLLTQVLGRVGRGHVSSTAIVQTYHPESPILQAAIHQDWQTFYDTELAERRKFHFPPYYHLLKLSCRRATPKSAESAAQKLKMLLSEKLQGLEIDGPAPSFHEKLQGKYQYQLVVKSTNRSTLLAAIRLLPSGWTYDIDPINLL